MKIYATVKVNKEGKKYRAVIIQSGEKHIIAGFKSAIYNYCYLFNVRFSDVCRKLEDGEEYVFADKDE